MRGRKKQELPEQIDFDRGKVLHVFNRGNNKQKIYFSISDFKRFRKKTHQFSKGCRVKILAECLMPNHFHFILNPTHSTPRTRRHRNPNVAKFIKRLCISHSRYINKKYDRVGHVFQGRYKQRILENEADLVAMSQYIIENPIEAHIVKYPWDYQWLWVHDQILKNFPLLKLQPQFLALQQQKPE